MSKSSERLEVEVKFLVDDLTDVRQRLLAAGAEVVRPRTYERNLRLDTEDEMLLQRWQLLRLRQDTAVTLTFKGPTASQQGSEVKVREELEVQLDDFDTAVTLFQRLGFHPTQIYEKYRETFSLNAVEVLLDELPFGDFVEIEGEEQAIKQTAAQLGLDWSRRVTTNYLALMEQLRAHHNLPFRDLTFDNFAGQSVSIADVLKGQTT